MLSLCACTASAQSERFNSICVISENDSIDLFQNERIDSITFSEENGAFYQKVWTNDAAKKFQVTTTNSVRLFNLYDSKIGYVESDTPMWENYYTTPIGVFAYKPSLPYEGETEQPEAFEVLSYFGEDWQQSAFLIFDKESGLPVRLAADTLTLYFAYSGDSICSLCIGRAASFEALGSFEINTSNIEKELNAAGYSTKLKRLLFKLLALTEGRTAEDAELQELLRKFRALLDVEEYMYPPMAAKPDDYLILVSVFKDRKEPGQKGKGNVLYSAVVSTNRHFNVTSNSCTAEGSVSCAYSQFNKYCSYGMLFDENPDSLFIGKADFMLSGYQDRFAGNFSVNVSGLKPATKYYYKAYLEINDYGNSPLTVRYDNGSHDEKGYDAMRPTRTYGATKSFTTDVPDISGTWNCVETHYRPSGNPRYETYTVTLNKDGSVDWSQNDNIVSSSYTVSLSGEVSIHIMDFATQTANSGVDWRGQIDDMQHPQKITGYTHRWNFNQIGAFNGDSYYFEMTR